MLKDKLAKIAAHLTGSRHAKKTVGDIAKDVNGD